MERIIIEEKDITIVLKYNNNSHQFYLFNILDLNNYQPKKEDLLVISFKFLKNNQDTFFKTVKLLKLFDESKLSHISKNNQKMLFDYIEHLKNDASYHSINLEEMFFDEVF
ncbi:hypothetical protein HOK00_05565 [bacterium]|nr:hypothetical protein [bacterium]